MTCEHEKSGSNQVLTPSGSFGEPCTGNDASAFSPDVIAAQRLLTKMINEGPKLWSPGHEQGFPV
jgi:hypothetical protein